MSVDIPALTGRILEQVEKIVVGKEEQTRKKEHPVVSDEIDYALNDMQYNPHDDAPVVDTIDIEGKEEQN